MTKYYNCDIHNAMCKSFKRVENNPSFKRYLSIVNVDKEYFVTKEAMFVS